MRLFAQYILAVIVFFGSTSTVLAASVLLEGTGANEYTTLNCSIGYDTTAKTVATTAMCDADFVGTYNNLAGTLTESGDKLVGNLDPDTDYDGYTNSLEFSDVTIDLNSNGIYGTVTNDVFGDMTLTASGITPIKKDVTVSGWAYNELWGFYLCQFDVTAPAGYVTASGQNSMSGCVMNPPLLGDVVFADQAVQLKNGYLEGKGITTYGGNNYDVELSGHDNPMFVEKGYMLTGSTLDGFSGEWNFRGEYQKGNVLDDNGIDIVDLARLNQVRNGAAPQDTFAVFRGDLVGNGSEVAPNKYVGTVTDIDGDDLEALAKKLFNAYY
jgi:hypothetical protein